MNENETRQITYYIEPYYRLVVYPNHVVIFSDSWHSKGKPLSVFYTKDGYPKVKMHNKGTMVHHVVAQHCIGPRPDGLVINHKDGVKTNSHPTNLEYVTHKENIHHAIKMGTHVASDPTRMPTYKDGRCIGRIAQYKHEWYMRNRERMAANAHKRYMANREHLKAKARQYYLASKNRNNKTVSA